MNIHEYQSKELFAKYGIPVPKGNIALSEKEIDAAVDSLDTKVWVVKSQIHAGGRGKAGGVKLAKTKEDAKKIAREMFGMTLVTHQTGPEGQKVRRVYIEEGSNIDKEYYLSILVDRATSKLVFIASEAGGMDIEEVAAETPEKIIKLPLSFSDVWPFQLRKLGFAIGLKGDILKQFCDIAFKMSKVFIETDAAQIEVNPLVVTKEEKIIALDAKITFDENALFRQKGIVLLRDRDEEDPLEERAKEHSLSYVTMSGNIGCMVNGAGLAMATMDIIKYYGGEPANFLDVGGGADKARVCEAFKIIVSDKNVKAILVNIFGGIMRCDVIAEGIIEAVKEVGLKIPLIVRLAGTNFELGKKILDKSGLNIISATDLGDAATKSVDVIRGK
jgi:succinyl-CoA synthetase beta subunit